MPNNDPIRHVVHLMMENRSFDQMLGGLQVEIPEIDGAIPPGAPVRTNADGAGTPFKQQPGAAWTMKPGPKHEHEHVMHQLEGGNAGFVRDYATAHADTTPQQRQEVMSFYGAGTLWALHGLARAFTVCDRWFSSVPGPTWTNRLFAMSGTSQGRVQMPSVSPFDLNLHRYDQTCLFDRLTEANVPWKIYFSDFPLSLLLKNVRSRAKELARVSQFFEAAASDEAAFPAFSFIEPGYFVVQNDDHPPHDIRRGQQLIASVYNALRANEKLWESTLLVVTYDEHGGFYDHVDPPAAPPPDEHHDEYTFDRYGARVPALLVSPWVSRRVLHERYDHTSVLRYLSDKWQLGALGQRVAEAKSFAQAIGTTLRDDTPATLAPPVLHAAGAVAVPAPSPVEALDDMQRAAVAFSEYLESQTQGAPAEKAARRAMLTVGPTQQAEAAEARAVAFLRERGADV